MNIILSCLADRVIELINKKISEMTLEDASASLWTVWNSYRSKNNEYVEEMNILLSQLDQIKVLVPEQDNNQDDQKKFRDLLLKYVKEAETLIQRHSKSWLKGLQNFLQLASPLHDLKNLNKNIREALESLSIAPNNEGENNNTERLSRIHSLNDGQANLNDPFGIANWTPENTEQTLKMLKDMSEILPSLHATLNKMESNWEDFIQEKKTGLKNLEEKIPIKEDMIPNDNQQVEQQKKKKKKKSKLSRDTVEHDEEIGENPIKKLKSESQQLSDQYVDVYYTNRRSLEEDLTNRCHGLYEYSFQDKLHMKKIPNALSSPIIFNEALTGILNLKDQKIDEVCIDLSNENIKQNKVEGLISFFLFEEHRNGNGGFWDHVRYLELDLSRAPENPDRLTEANFISLLGAIYTNVRQLTHLSLRFSRREMISNYNAFTQIREICKNLHFLNVLTVDLEGCNVNERLVSTLEWFKLGVPITDDDIVNLRGNPFEIEEREIQKQMKKGLAEMGVEVGSEFSDLVDMGAEAGSESSDLAGMGIEIGSGFSEEDFMRGKSNKKVRLDRIVLNIHI